MGAKSFTNDLSAGSSYGYIPQQQVNYVETMLKPYVIRTSTKERKRRQFDISEFAFLLASKSLHYSRRKDHQMLIENNFLGRPTLDAVALLPMLSYSFLRPSLSCFAWTPLHWCTCCEACVWGPRWVAGSPLTGSSR